MFDTLLRRVLELSETQPEKLACAFKKDRLTYEELSRKILRIAGRLKEEGVKEGDRVLYSAMQKPMTFAAYFAIQYLHAVAVPVDRTGTAESVLMVYDDAEATLFLTDMKLPADIDPAYRIMSLKALYADETEAVLAASDYTLPDPESPAEILFTTGTTGRPKGVILGYRSIYHILCNTRDGIGITGEDILLEPLPLHHSLALRECRAVFYEGGTVILQNGFAFAREVELNQENFGCTGIVMVPVSMELLRTQMQEHFYEIMDRFRYIEVGAGALTVEQRKRLNANLHHAVLNNTWGSSETGGALFTRVSEVADHEARVSTLGRPLDGIEIKMLDADGSEIRGTHDHPGRLALKGGMVMLGYYNRPEQTADALRDGWLVTNDLVYTDDDGYVFMLGRSDDIINVGGEKLSPIEVENAACEYPYMKECACIGVADTEGALGQVPILFAAVSEGYSEADFKSWLMKRVERYKIPAHVVLVDAVPRNRMQKLDRRAMRTLWDEKYAKRG